MVEVRTLLAPYVAGLTVYDATAHPGVHIGMPSTCLTLVLPIDEPLDVGWAGQGHARGTFWAGLAAPAGGGRRRMRLRRPGAPDP